MIKKCIKRIWLSLSLFYLLLLTFPVNADDNLSIIEKTTNTETQHINRRIQFIWSNPWRVMDNIHKAHEDLNLSERRAWGILEIDDIINYLVFIVQFLSQLWLIVWAIFIMYAWYKYMLTILNWSWKAPSSTLKNAIIGIIIVIFSYAIMRILTSFIWLT